MLTQFSQNSRKCNQSSLVSFSFEVLVYTTSEKAFYHDLDFGINSYSLVIELIIQGSIFLTSAIIHSASFCEYYKELLIACLPRSFVKICSNKSLKTSNIYQNPCVSDPWPKRFKSCQYVYVCHIVLLVNYSLAHDCSLVTSNYDIVNSSGFLIDKSWNIREFHDVPWNGRNSLISLHALFESVLSQFGACSIAWISYHLVQHNHSLFDHIWNVGKIYSWKFLINLSWI